MDKQQNDVQRSLRTTIHAGRICRQQKQPLLKFERSNLKGEPLFSENQGNLFTLIIIMQTLGRLIKNCAFIRECMHVQYMYPNEL